MTVPMEFLTPRQIRVRLAAPPPQEPFETLWVRCWGRTEDNMARGILLWLLGVPIPVIIILALLWH